MKHENETGKSPYKGIYPSYYKDKGGTRYIKRADPTRGWERMVKGGTLATNYGSKELFDKRLESFEPCSEEDYMNALR